MPPKFTPMDPYLSRSLFCCLCLRLYFCCSLSPCLYSVPLSPMSLSSPFSGPLFGLMLTFLSSQCISYAHIHVHLHAAADPEGLIRPCPPIRLGNRVWPPRPRNSVVRVNGSKKE